MKGYPKGWKPAKVKFKKAPTPPPGFAHTPKMDKDSFKRKNEKRDIDEQMRDDTEDFIFCAICGKNKVSTSVLGGVCKKCEEGGD